MRLVSLLKSKIHRARVTEVNVNYVGSITIDRALMEKANLLEGELVHIWNVTNGERFETYVLSGPPNSGVIEINGAAAHRCSVGDELIIAAFVLTDEPVEPRIVFVNEKNEVLEANDEWKG